MLRRELIMLGVVGLLAVPAVADDQAHPRCCAKRAKDVATNAVSRPEKGEKLRCSLTGKVVDTCCCVERDGKTYCTLAKKSVERCCCVAAGTEATEPK